MTKQELINEVTNLVGSQRNITSDIKNRLYDLGFRLIAVGTKDEVAINTKDIKIDFLGYDVAVGVGAQAISYGSRRRYYALVIKLG